MLLTLGQFNLDSFHMPILFLFIGFHQQIRDEEEYGEEKEEEGGDVVESVMLEGEVVVDLGYGRGIGSRMVVVMVEEEKMVDMG